MVVEIMDYKNNKKSVDIGELENIDSIILRVISGDEILDVLYKNKDVNSFDSYDRARLQNYYDGCKVLYSTEMSINRLEDENFLNRKDSYDWLFQ